MSEIARKAKTAKGTFYIYFDSKAKVISELFEKYDDYYDEVYENMDKNLTPKDLQAWVPDTTKCRHNQVQQKLHKAGDGSEAGETVEISNIK